jgi:DNA-binding IscR family transcriptional regulator
MDFIEKVEGPQGLVDCNIEADCDLVEYCNIRKPIRVINDNLKNMFSNISLSEITQ